jgi:hypothetical protein
MRTAIDYEILYHGTGYKVWNWETDQTSQDGEGICDWKEGRIKDNGHILCSETHSRKLKNLQMSAALCSVLDPILKDTCLRQAYRSSFPCFTPIKAEVTQMVHV